VLGLVGDVAGKFAEAERELAAEIERGTDENHDAAEDEKRTTDFAEVHGESLEGETELRKGRLRGQSLQEMSMPRRFDEDGQTRTHAKAYATRRLRCGGEGRIVRRWILRRW